jgi:hypothetical protein
MKYDVLITNRGNKFYYKKGTGILHREDGPAIEHPDGSKEWWINGAIHREDGPAAEFSDGSKEWYINGKLHRIDGPAVVYPDGHRRFLAPNNKKHTQWWIIGKRLSPEKEAILNQWWEKTNGI